MNLNLWLRDALLAYSAAVAGAGNWLAGRVSADANRLSHDLLLRLAALWVEDAARQPRRPIPPGLIADPLTGGLPQGAPRGLAPDRSRLTRWSNALTQVMVPHLQDQQRTLLSGVVFFAQHNHTGLSTLYAALYQTLRRAAPAALGRGAAREGLMEARIPRLNFLFGQGLDRIATGDFGAGFQPLPEPLARDLVSEPLAGLAWDERMADLGAAGQRAIRQVISQATGNGWSMDQAAAALRQQVGLSAERASLIARTEIQHVANLQNALFYQASSDILAGLRFVATLDPRTCPVCGALDGKVFYFEPTGGQAPTPGPTLPLHPRCRCCYAPLTKTWKELGIDLQDVEPAWRASMGGPVPAPTTFYSWLKGQPPAVVRQVLGVKRGAAFLDGAILPELALKGLATFAPTGLAATAQAIARPLLTWTPATAGLPADTWAAIRNIAWKAKKNRGIASVRALAPAEEVPGQEGRGIEVLYRNGGSSILSVEAGARPEALRQLTLLVRRYRLPSLPS